MARQSASWRGNALRVMTPDGQSILELSDDDPDVRPYLAGPLSVCGSVQRTFRHSPEALVTVQYMDEFRARLSSPGRRIADTDRGKENGTMTPQQRALVAELRAADYPAAWKLSASTSDDKLAASGTRIQPSMYGRSSALRRS
jgi:hypothetical protein